MQRVLIIMLVFLIAGLYTRSCFSLTLNEGLEIVTFTGRDVKISEAEEEISREGVSLARTPLFPRVDLYANQTWLRYQPETAFETLGVVPMSEKDFFTYGFKVNQLVYDFGKTYSTIRAARFSLRSKKLKTTQVKNLVALNFTLAYLDLLESEKLIEMARNEVKRLEAHLNDTKAMYEEGLIIKNDLLQAEVMLSDARQRLLTEENLRAIRASRINSLLMRPLDKELYAEEMEVKPFTQIVLDDAWKIAERGRTELKEIQMEIDTKINEIKAVTAEYYPRVYLAGGYEFQKNRYMVHEENWSLVAGISLNLSSGGATRTRASMIEAEIRTLELKREKLLDSIRLEVMGAYLDLQNAKNKVLVTEKAVEQAEENLRLQTLRYKEEVGIATDVIDAVTLLTKAGANYQNSTYDLNRAEARLLYYMGIDLVQSYGN